MSSYPPLPEPHLPATNRATALAPDNAPTPAEAVARPVAQQKYQKPAPIWLQRISLLVQVMFCVYLGILLVILPWWPHLLENNELISAYPMLHDWLSLGAVRGIISGIGLLDIWIGVSEVIHYHEVRS